MRQFTIFQRQPHGAVFVKLPDYFKVEISIKNDMVLLLLERLSEVILADICSFVSGEYEDGKEPELPYHPMGGCFDIDAYVDNWLEYYDLISDDEDILDEYTDPEEETDE